MKEHIMEIRQVTDSRNQHIVAIEKDGELRCFFRSSASHTAAVALNNLNIDIFRHGESVVKFDELPLINKRIAKSGRTIYDVAE